MPTRQIHESAALLAARCAFLQLCQNLVYAKAAGFLARREFLKRFEELSDDGLRRYTNIGMVEPPVVIGVRRDVRLLIRIGPQVEELRKPQGSERFLPYQQSSLGTLFSKNKLPVVVAQTDQVGVIIKVVELLAWTLLRLTGQEWQHVIAVEMDLKGFVTDFHAFEELLLHVGNSGRRKERR